MDWKHIQKQLSELYSRDGITDFQSIQDEAKSIRRRIQQTNHIATIWNPLFNRIEALQLTPQERSLWLLIAILYLTEGPLSLQISYMIQYLLWKDNIWTINKPTISFNEIRRTKLYTRLRYLAGHGFPFMSDICPRSIRNAIAHQDYTS